MVHTTSGGPHLCEKTALMPHENLELWRLLRQIHPPPPPAHSGHPPKLSVSRVVSIRNSVRMKVLYQAVISSSRYCQMHMFCYFGSITNPLPPTKKCLRTLTGGLHTAPTSFSGLFPTKYAPTHPNLQGKKGVCAWFLKIYLFL